MGKTEKAQKVRHTSPTKRTFNIYCDESSHLENDHHQVMVLGAVWCPLDKSREIAVRIREIKRKHNMRPDFEVKWKKVSPARAGFTWT